MNSGASPETRQPPMASATGSSVSESARRLASGGLRRTLGWQVARTVSRLAFAGSAALLLGRMIMGGGIENWMFIAVPLSLGLSILAGFAAEETQATAETRVARDLRGIARLKLQDMLARMVQSVPAGQVLVCAEAGARTAAAIMAIAADVARLTRVALRTMRNSLPYRE